MPKRAGAVLLSMALLAGLTAFFRPWFLFREGVLGGPWWLKVVTLTRFVGPPAFALLAVALAIYYALTGRRGGWWLVGVVLTVVVSFLGYLARPKLLG